MVAAARHQGLEYLAITEHSKRLTMGHGLDSRRLLEQIEEIDPLNDRLREHTEGFRVLKGIEVDILEDGGLDLPDPILERLDCSAETWLDLVKNFRKRFRTEAGRPVTLQGVCSLRRTRRHANSSA